jgi:hypothetical protein
VATEKGFKMEIQETLEVRFDKAFKAVRRAGITARRNVMSCCRSCVDLGLADNVPVVWHFGGQGRRVSISGDYTDSPILLLNHSNLVSEGKLTSAGEVVLKAFADNGFEVKWENFSEFKCLEVVLA